MLTGSGMDNETGEIRDALNGKGLGSTTTSTNKEYDGLSGLDQPEVLTCGARDLDKQY